MLRSGLNRMQYNLWWHATRACFGFVLHTTCFMLISSVTGTVVLGQDVSEHAQSDRIRKILTTRCSGCHNASDRKGGLDITSVDKLMVGGDSGPAIVPGAPADSLIWQRIEAAEMPPKGPLANDEVQVIRQWIEAKTHWTGGDLDPLEYTSDARAGYDWWALQPLQNVAPPVIDGCENPIDAFVSRSLHQAGLALSPSADRKTLVRRIALDLTGLPPAQSDAVSLDDQDSSSFIAAYIDRLLDSPEYGQRWARHWLDTVRFGESHGFERDQLRTNSWRYRDWVVQSLNRDLPYDQFVKLQLAGDAIESSAADGIVATGMLVAGSYDQVGQTQQSAAMRAVVRQDELEDLVSVVGQTFLGLTVNCSRCHDHKFDPIPQREYYAMCAALAGTNHGERSLPKEFVDRTSEQLVPRIDRRISELKQVIDQIETPVRERLLREKSSRKVNLTPPSPIAVWEFDDLKDSRGGMDLSVVEPASIKDGRLHVSGAGYAFSSGLKQPIKEKTLEAWVLLNSDAQRGGAAVSLQSRDGVTFDAIVFGELEAKKWMPGSNGYVRSGSFQSELDESPGTVIHIAMAYDADGTIRAFRNGIPYGTPVRQSDLVTYPTETSQVLFGLRHSPATRDRVLDCQLERACLYDRALTDEEVSASAGSLPVHVSNAEIERELRPDEMRTLQAARFEWGQLKDQKNRIGDTKVYAVVAKEVKPTFVLDRGNPGSPLDEVFPQGIDAIRGLDAAFSPRSQDDDKQRRLQLASWITDARNPLFARVIVNRVWQYHFGTGIVDTPNDFGFNGGRPSHPELLDWLANDLISHGWSLKHLHRTIMNSQTYQQSSRVSAEGMAKDAQNRLLWRKSPLRLDAETLRDTLLDLAGCLDRSLDGPGIYDFSLYVNNSHFYAMRDPTGESFDRRTLYRTWVRSARSNLLDVFDCPDPSTKTPQRASTTTPLQSLSLLNNSFVLRIADRWADQISQSHSELDQQIVAVFERSYHRQPSDAEKDACIALARKHGLAAVCRVILNSNELLYVD